MAHTPIPLALGDRDLGLKSNVLQRNAMRARGANLIYLGVAPINETMFRSLASPFGEVLPIAPHEIASPSRCALPSARGLLRPLPI